MSPTKRTLAKLRAEGWPRVEVTERWNPFAKVRVDLFGFIDVLAINDASMLAVQTTTADHVSHRIEKMRSIPAVIDWLKGRDRKIEVHGWAKRGERGKVKRWTCRVVTLEVDTALKLIVMEEST